MSLSASSANLNRLPLPRSANLNLRPQEIINQDHLQLAGPTEHLILTLLLFWLISAQCPQVNKEEARILPDLRDGS